MWTGKSCFVIILCITCRNKMYIVVRARTRPAWVQLIFCSGAFLPARVLSPWYHLHQYYLSGPKSDHYLTLSLRQSSCWILLKLLDFQSYYLEFSKAVTWICKIKICKNNPCVKLLWGEKNGWKKVPIKGGGATPIGKSRKISIFLFWAPFPNKPSPVTSLSSPVDVWGSPVIDLSRCNIIA